MSAAQDLPTLELPALHDRCDEAATHGQRLHARSSAARLYFGIAAAAMAAFATEWKRGDLEILGIGAAFAFFCALVIELWMLRVRPERVWYEARAIAESCKSWTWRYAVGGSPHPIGADDADIRYGEALDGLAEEARLLGVAVQSALGGVSESLAGVRAGSLDVRRAAYLEMRVIDQQHWYERKAAINAGRATALKVAMLIGEIAGVFLALAKAFGMISIDLSGIAATAISAGAAWLAVRQHEVVARTYAVAAGHLRQLADGLRQIDDEIAWGRAVHHTEEALLRENATWHVSRTDRAVHQSNPFVERTASQ